MFAVLRKSETREEVSRELLWPVTLSDNWLPKKDYLELEKKAYQIYKPKRSQFVSIETEDGKADRMWINPEFHAALFE